uniref:Uncharacterized protein n=1 Tax=Romanomermis culicivorax TaxID=13658 RepID=A0A915J180_ROMCU
MEERVQRAYNRLKAALTYYLTCAHLHKKRKQPLPSKQELDDRSPATGKSTGTTQPFAITVDAARSTTTTTPAVQETAVKVQTPYWAIRQRLPKTAIIYEESLVREVPCFWRFKCNKGYLNKAFTVELLPQKLSK